MKIRNLGCVIALVSLLGGGYAATPRDPNVTMVSGTVGWPNRVAVHFWAKKLDDRTYEIVEYGDNGLTQAQYLGAWVWMANKLAAGRPYAKEMTAEPHRYEGMMINSVPTDDHVGTKVTGRIVLQ